MALRLAGLAGRGWSSGGFLDATARLFDDGNPRRRCQVFEEGFQQLQFAMRELQTDVSSADSAT